MTVLCYVRPWNENQFKEICKAAFPDQKIYYISDFPGHISGFQAQINNAYTKGLMPLELFLKEHEIDDIILRCRLLRNIPLYQAKILLYGVMSVIEKLFKQYEPKIVIGVTVDSYVIDLIRLYAEKKGVQYTGLIPSFLNGYCRITARGEYRKVRDVSDSEVEQVYEQLKYKNQQPNYLSKFETERALLQKWKYNKRRNKLRHYYMSLKRLQSKEYKHCYHYWASMLVFKGTTERVDSTIFERKLELDSSEVACYLPLHFFPECTVDYWTKDQKLVHYYASILDVVSQLAKLKIKVYIKEHPNALGFRPIYFYQELKKYKNLVLVCPSVNSRDMIKQTNFTLVWTGTAGIEAYLLEKPVVEIGSPYYLHDKSFIKFNDFVKDFSKHRKIVNKSKNGKELVRHILENTVKAPFYHDFDKRPQKESKNEMKTLGQEIKRYSISTKFCEAKNLCV